ncbi:hypothetical protein CCR75_009149 [Bremia lactucae]|uniref:Uncharacterized protein n=1 Tax=Bremia lactucae TaxID=4779 RepID=A0A976IEN1_BRELC|nr:hypothetical protein CCR75_009149 [Bremia lactucae]
MTLASDNGQLDPQLYTMIALEHTRYCAFYAKLSNGASNSWISRTTALDFYRKSSLPEAQVQELYARIKEQHLLRDKDRMNETEFVMGMHLIVCITKRNLVSIPPTFPSYLFPLLNLTPERLREDPFLAPFPEISKASNDSILKPSISSFDVSNNSHWSTAKSLEPFRNATSLREFVSIGIHKKQEEAKILQSVDESETNALTSFQACLVNLLNQVNGLGYSIPTSARSFETITDLKSLLQQYVHEAKQEIQSLQIETQMKTVASLKVATSDDVRDSLLDKTSHLTQELMILQHQTAQLMTVKAKIIARLLAGKQSGSVATTVCLKSTDLKVQGHVEAKHSALGLSKGALTVGELQTIKKSATRVNFVLQRDAKEDKNGGTFQAATAPVPTLDDPFVLESAPRAQTELLDATHTTESEKRFDWGAFN